VASLDVREGKTGTTYRVRWRIGGSRSAPWDSQSFKGRGAERAALKFKAQIEGNDHRRLVTDEPEHRAGGITVGELVTQHLEDRAKRVRSERTVKDYERDAGVWITPFLGSKEAETLADHDVQDWVDAIPRSPKTVANIHGILSGAYKYGIRKHLVTSNPCAATDLPARDRTTVRGLRPGEWAILYQAACEVGPDVADLLLFLVGTGWRWSEATALQVHAVELDARTPMARMNQVWRRGGDNRLKLVEGAKSDAGVRGVALSPALVQMLKRRTTGKQLGDFVFTNDRTRQKWQYGNFRRRRWAAVLERAQALGLRSAPTIHWLRHTHAAMLIEAGGNLPAIQRRLGHASITTTVNTYGRLVDDVPAEVLGSVDEALVRRPGLRLVEDA
jgi:integrase